MILTGEFLLQRIPRKEKDESEESGWSERTTEMRMMMGDRSSERRKIKAKNSTPSRLVSEDMTVQVLSHGTFLSPCVLSHLNIQKLLPDKHLSKCNMLHVAMKTALLKQNVDHKNAQPVIM